MATCDQILACFFQSYFERKGLKERVRRDKAAIIIQRAFRKYLFLQTRYFEQRSRAAYRIQSVWRRYGAGMKGKIKFNDPTRSILAKFTESIISLPGPPKDKAPRPSRRRVIASLLPPWRNKNKNKLTPHDIELLEEEQKDNMKWVTKDIMFMFTKNIFNDLTKRDDLLVQNIKYVKRYVSKTFFTLSYLSNETNENVLCSFIHSPTLCVYSVSKDHVSKQNISTSLNEVEDYYFNRNSFIVDADMHKLSGRIFCLLNDWRITIFEDGYYSIPQTPAVERPICPQSKYIFVDKFCHLWIIDTSHRNTIYMLDPLCFSVIQSFKMFLPNKKIAKLFFPIYEGNKLKSFFITSKSDAVFYICNLEGNPVNDFDFHIRFSPNFTVTKSHLITFGKDRKMCLYKRLGDKLTELTSFFLPSIPNSVAFIHGFKLIAVAQSDCTISFYTMTNENYSLTLPMNQINPEIQDIAYKVIGEPCTTQSRSIYSRVLMIRVVSQAKSISSIQFAENAALVQCHLLNGNVVVFWLLRQSFKVKCTDFDLIIYPPMVGTPKLYTRYICENLFAELEKPVEKTRRQFSRDSLYLHQVGYEFEKRFIAGRFGTKGSLDDAAEIIMQSPFKRWLRVFNYLEKNSISIFELFYFTRFLVVEKLKTVAEMNDYIIQHLSFLSSPPVGVTNKMISTRFTLNDMKQVLPLFSKHCSEDLENYLQTIHEQKFQNKAITFASILLKTAVCEKNMQTIYRLSEIENIVKNRMFANTTRKSFISSLRCPKYTLKVPEIVPENSMPQFTSKWMQKSRYLMPNPLIERFRYRSCRELEIDEKEIEYCSYGTESPYARIVPMKHIFPLQEIRISRPMAKMSMILDLIAISTDSTKYIVQYPIENVPLNYVLLSNPFRNSESTTILIARYWLSQILMMVAGLHKHNIVVRSLLPSNFFVSYDGVNVQIQSLGDALFVKDKDDKPLPFQNTPWNPPECYISKSRVGTPFDIFQFGVLMVYMLTGMLPNSFGDILKTHLKMTKKSIDDILDNENFLYDPFDGLPVNEYPVFVKKGTDLIILIDVESEFSLMDIVRTCMDINPKHRPTARQLLQHPFFNLPRVLAKRARIFASRVVKRVPMPLLVDGIFYTLFSKIADEMSEEKAHEESQAPSLSIAVNILNYFLNPTEESRDIRVSFPIDNRMKNELVDEVFNQHIFAQMVTLVVRHLQTRFEKGKSNNIDKDESFLEVVSLYHKFFEYYLDQPTVFSKCFDSFRFLATGINTNCDSFSLSIFLHRKLRPLVEFFFTKIHPKSQRELPVSSFYCDHFMEFYDNNRDFGEGLVEKSELRCLSVLSFYKHFLEFYQNEDTLSLFHDFSVTHKIEICMNFTQHSVKLEALHLSIALLGFKFADKKIFDSYVSSYIPLFIVDENASYKEKVASLEITRLILFSKSLIAISRILMINIIDSLLFCCTSKASKSLNSVWGTKDDVKICDIALELLRDVCEKGMNNLYKRFVFHCEDIYSDLSKMKLIDYHAYIDFKEEMKIMNTNKIITDSLRSILLIAESSPLSSVLAMTQTDKEGFVRAVNYVSDYLLKMDIIDPDLFKSLVRIWDHHQLTPYQPLLDRIKNEFEKKNKASVKLVINIFGTLRNIPPSMITLSKSWFAILREEYSEIRQMIQKRVNNQNVIDYYSESRKTRINFLKSILKAQDPKLTSYFERQTEFLELLLTEMLPDVNKFDINMRILPHKFAIYNQTYPIRSEAENFIREIIIQRGRNVPLFYFFSQSLRLTGVLEKEAENILKVADPVYRKTTIRLLNILDEKDSPFEVSRLVLKNRLLLNLKDEEMNDWDNFQILRNAFSTDNKPPDNKRIRPLFDSL